MSDRTALVQELLSRVRANNSLIAFTKFTNPSYQPAPHHYRIAEKLEAVERGEIKRLMICMPPRHGKSELASRRFPAWVLGRNPSKQIIASSYNSDLANDFGRDVRNVVASEEYGAVFEGVSLASDSKASDRWHTKHGGVYVAAGVGTAITGRGADILLIDDPFKDRQEADSEARRKSVWEWYRSTAYTRLMPGGAIVVINTRWHEDDLSGRLLELSESGEGDEWELLSLPAIEDETALWPDWYPIEKLEEIRGVIGEREWNALYQQNPAPDDGEYFKRDWFKDFEKLPEGLHIYGASDYAVTDGGGDWTEHGVFGIHESGDIYVLDWWRGQKSPDVWVDAKCDLIKKHTPLCWFGEGGVIRKSVEPFMLKRMNERGAHCRVEWLNPVGDKAARCRGFQALASMGKVWFPEGKRWASDVMAQLLKFPAGKHDDAVDVCSLLGRGLEFVRKPKRKPAAAPTRPPVALGGWMSA